ncbi:MAG TPA: hypothetical protein VFM18_16575 [Methanosarcina sp.]|nr:hypothetical protein [Methanosarcina sp.]
MNRYQPYIETASGKKVFFLEPDPEQIDIKDIALALSRIPRFNGHTNRFYSVAEHCWTGQRFINNEYKLAFLLHDATEAYLCDIPSPIKQYLPDYKKIERGLEEAISIKYGWNSYLDSDMIKYMDLAMLSVEAQHLIESRGNDWQIWKTINRPVADYRMKPLCLDSKTAERFYLSAFYELYGTG